MLYIEVDYKFEEGISTRVHDVLLLDSDNDRVTFDNDGYPCSVHKLSSFSDSGISGIKFFIDYKSQIGIILYVLSEEGYSDSLYNFVNSICENHLKEHINKCVIKSDCFNIENLENLLRRSEF